MIRRLLALVLAASALALVAIAAAPAPVRAEDCGHHCSSPTPDPPADSSPTPTVPPTSYALPPVSPGPTLPPTATPVPTSPPPPPSVAPLPAGDAPQIDQTSPTPNGVLQSATLPTGGAPASTSNPLGTIVLIAFLVLLASLGLSTWLFFKLR